MLSTWLIMSGIALGIALALNRLFQRNLRWFFRLRRPRWLTFEWAIPFIWTAILISGAGSASILWNQAPNALRTYFLMSVYLLLEVVILSYTPVMCHFRSLRVGVAIGAAGFGLGLLLGLIIWPLSSGAFALLLPYLLWSPIGTWVTWQMISLNPDAA